MYKNVVCRGLVNIALPLYPDIIIGNKNNCFPFYLTAAPSITLSTHIWSECQLDCLNNINVT